MKTKYKEDEKLIRKYIQIMHRKVLLEKVEEGTGSLELGTETLRK